MIGALFARVRRAPGEIAVIGLGRSGAAVATLLRRDGYRLYASDGSESPALHTTAAKLRALGVDVDVGAHDLDRIAKSALVIVSPHVHIDAERPQFRGRRVQRG
jgi:UDP-N-acetylmuramoylalanine-D-glutamate ligase